MRLPSLVARWHLTDHLAEFPRVLRVEVHLPEDVAQGDALDLHLDRDRSTLNGPPDLAIDDETLEPVSDGDI